MAAEALAIQNEEETSTRRMNNPLFGNLADEFRRQTSPLPRQKKLHSDFAELPIDPRTEASQQSVGQIISRFSPSVQQMKEVFNTIPQYAFQDIPPDPRDVIQQQSNRLSPLGHGPQMNRSSRNMSPGFQGRPGERNSTTNQPHLDSMGRPDLRSPNLSPPNRTDGPQRPPRPARRKPSQY